MRSLIILLAMLLLVASAHAQHYGPATAAPANTLTIWSSTDLDAFGPVLDDFIERNPGVAIDYSDINTNELYDGAAKACAASGSSADLLISSAIDLQVRLVNDGCAQTHVSDITRRLPAWANWRSQVFGLTFEPVVIAYNRDLLDLGDKHLSRFDLVDMLRDPGGKLDGKVVTYDIEMSGVGYLFAFMDSLQATTFGRLIESLGRNHTVASCCVAEMLDAVAEGRYLIAYNVLGSYAIARAKRDPRIGIIYPEDYTLLLSRAAIIPTGAANAGLAKRFLDFVLSEEGKAILADAMLIIKPRETLASGDELDLPGESSLRPITPNPVLLVGLDREKRRLFTSAWRNTIGPARDTP